MSLLNKNVFLLVGVLPVYIPRLNLVSEQASNTSQWLVVDKSSLQTIEGRGFGMETIASEKATKYNPAPMNNFFVKRDTSGGEIQGFKSGGSISFYVANALAFINGYPVEYSTQVALIVCTRVLYHLSKISNLAKYPLSSRYMSYIGITIYCPAGIIESVTLSWDKDKNGCTFDITYSEMEFGKELMPSAVSSGAESNSLVEVKPTEAVNKSETQKINAGQGESL